MNIIKNKSIIYLILLLAASILTIIPFFHSGFFTMHDDTQVARVYEMFLSLRSGMFPVRWVMDLGYGYGYPIFNFYAPLAYYIGAFFMFFNLDALIATKVMMLLGTIMAGISMYFFAKDIWGEEGGFIAGIFYLFAPYHAVNIYIRGAVGEFWGMAFLPLIFYGVWNTYKSGKWRYVVLGSVSYAGVILSHNLTAMMITPFLLVVISVVMLHFLLKKDYGRTLRFIIMLLLGITLSAFYWLPAIGEMQYTNVTSQISGTGSKFADHFVCLTQLWNSPWGYAGSAQGCVDGVSFRIGKLHVFAVLLSVFLIFPIYKKSKEKSALLLVSICFFLFATYLTLQNSEWLWNSLSPMSYLQFPWRFLLLIIFFSSFVIGGVVWYAKDFLMKKILFYAFLFLVTTGVVILYGKLFTPQMFTDVTPQTLMDQNTIRYATSKVSDEYMPKNFIKPKSEQEIVKEKAYIVEGGGSIYPSLPKANGQAFRITSQSPVTVLLKTAPFPAWKTVTEDGEIPHENTNRGILVTIPAGVTLFALQYVSTKLELIGNSITLTSMVALLVGIIYLQRKKML